MIIETFSLVKIVEPIRRTRVTLMVALKASKIIILLIENQFYLRGVHPSFNSAKAKIVRHNQVKAIDTH